MSGRSEQMRLVKALIKQGFTVERTGNGHWKVTREGVGGVTYMSFSPSGAPQHKTIKLLKAMGYKP